MSSFISFFLLHLPSYEGFFSFLPFKALKQASAKARGWVWVWVGDGHWQVNDDDISKVGLKRGPWMPEEDEPDYYAVVSHDLGEPSAW
jgi:hypothetical protein